VGPRDQVERTIRRHAMLAGGETVLVAVSGGADSVALLHFLVELAPAWRLQLHVLHVDHQLRPDSPADADFVRAFGARLGVPVDVVTVMVDPRGSVEAGAREARYAALEAAAARLGAHRIAVGHTADDQAETVLMRLLEGAGVRGLAGIPPVRGRIIRPLIDMHRAALEAALGAAGVSWVEDPTNMETQFARNFLRAKVLPIIRQQWQGVDAAIARSANHMAEAARLLGNLGRADFLRIADGAGVNVAALRALPAARRRNALRSWIARFQIDAPSTVKMAEIAGSLLSARPDAQPEVAWPGAVIRRRAGRLILEVRSRHLVTGSPDFAAKSWDWSKDRLCILSRSGQRLELVDDDAGPIDLALLPQLLEIRARAGGETLRPGPRARTQALKKLIQAAKMSVEERAHLPLLFSGDRLIAAADRWIDASIAANDKSRRRGRLVWTRQ